MKLSKILTTAAVAFAATFALSGCIRETFPKESTITNEQLMGGNIEVVIENLLKGIPRGMLSPAYGVWEHTDFGWPSVNVYHDQAAQVICNHGWTLGFATGYNRFMLGAWGQGYGATGWMPHHFWYSYYPQIKSCNDVIRFTAGDENLVNSAAIARAYRASFYLDLARLFECLYVDENLSGEYAAQQMAVEGLTVPIVTENTKEADAKNNPRATREEIFTLILEDLAFAEEVMSSEGYVTTAPSDPTLAVIYGLYARTYLWLGGFDDGLGGELPEGNDAYTLAQEYANKAIAAFGGAVMSEAEWTNVTTGFNTKASSWMWYLQHSTDTVYNNLIQFPAHMAPEASYGYCPFTQPGVSAATYEMLGDNDFRKKLIVAPEHYTRGMVEDMDGNIIEGWILDETKVAAAYAAFKPYTQLSMEEFASYAPYTFFKFRPAQGNRTDYITAGSIAVPLMRCEEMYFIDMECAYHLNGADAAFSKLVNWMVTYRDPGFQTGTAQGEGIRDLIIKQKAVEFWGEGIVMYDMKRLDMGLNSNDKFYDPRRRFEFEGRLPQWTPMIPEGETQVNQGITGTENNPDPTAIVDASVKK